MTDQELDYEAICSRVRELIALCHLIVDKCPDYTYLLDSADELEKLIEGRL